MPASKGDLKIRFSIVNVIWAVWGLVQIGGGIWMMVDQNVSRHLEVIGIANSPYEPLIWQAARIFVPVGVLSCILAVTGVLGAIGDNQLTLFAYVTLGFLVAIPTLAAPIMVMVYKDNNIEKNFDVNMMEHVKFVYLGMDKGGDPHSSRWTRALDDFQHHAHCCGGENYTDFRYSKWWNATRRRNVSESLQLEVPTTCCNLKSTSNIDNANTTALEECQQDARMEMTESDILYTKGCRPVLRDWYDRRTRMCAVMGIGAFTGPLIGILYGCCLMCVIQEDSNKRSYVT